ncbi:MAG TPA: HlyD family efflux transporter periplasmic adaptor subunit [Bryobacteraceae bacterium]|jgi:membrane fusion protein (multidrug efflux system)
MANSFHRVSQSLRLDKGLWPFTAILIALTLVAAWLVWAFRARVTHYEVSDSARLEVNGAAYPVQADVPGRLLVSKLVLGKEVHTGDILLELESKDEQLSLEQERIHRASLEPQFAALRSQMQSEDSGRLDDRKVLTVSTSGAQAQYREAEAQAKLAQQEAARADRLHAAGLISEADAQRTDADAQSKRAAADNMKAAISRLQPELRVRERDREVRLDQVTADITKLQAEAAASSANIKRLEYEIERRRLRAPITGTLSECATVRAGAYITEGQQVGVIVPRRKLEVVAEFSPAAALGKLHPGQPAIVRLDGFPWAQFGTLSAKVSRVAGEIRDGKVRVELAVNTASHSRIPFQHGLPGSVEVEVERTSPAMLLLRSAGEALGAH